MRKGGHMQFKESSLKLASILILDIQPLELWENKVLLFKPLVCDFLMAAIADYHSSWVLLIWSWSYLVVSLLSGIQEVLAGLSSYIFHSPNLEGVISVGSTDFFLREMIFQDHHLGLRNALCHLVSHCSRYFQWY